MAMYGAPFTHVRRTVRKDSYAYQLLRGSRRDGELMTCIDVLNLWRTGDEDFHQCFTEVLTSCPFGDFYWECVPFSACTLAQPFEFVLTDAQGQLSRTRACANDFLEHFRHGDSNSVTHFPNLGRDAMLVVPKHCRGTTKNMCASSLRAHVRYGDNLSCSQTCVYCRYGHLASFVRGAPEQQQKELWRQTSEQVATIFESCDQTTPLWLSTDGRGVPWLHVRLDSTPKYVKHREYTDMRQYHANDTHPPYSRNSPRPTNVPPNRSTRNPKPRRNESVRQKSLSRQVNDHVGKRDEMERMEVDEVSLYKEVHDRNASRTAELPPPPPTQDHASSASGKDTDPPAQSAPLHDGTHYEADLLNANTHVNLNGNGTDCAHSTQGIKEEGTLTSPTQELVEVCIVYHRVMRVVKKVRVLSTISRQEIAQHAIHLLGGRPLNNMRQDMQDAARSMNGLHLYLSGDELQGEGPAVKGGLKPGAYIEVVDGM